MVSTRKLFGTSGVGERGPKQQGFRGRTLDQRRLRSQIAKNNHSLPARESQVQQNVIQTSQAHPLKMSYLISTFVMGESRHPKLQKKVSTIPGQNPKIFLQALHQLHHTIPLKTLPPLRFPNKLPVFRNGSLQIAALKTSCMLLVVRNFSHLPGPTSSEEPTRIILPTPAG